MQGIVKWFDAKKGYGFITADNGTEYFVHYTQIKTDGFKTLDEGASVSFEVAEVNGKESATNVVQATA